MTVGIPPMGKFNSVCLNLNAAQIHLRDGLEMAFFLSIAKSYPVSSTFFRIKYPNAKLYSIQCIFFLYTCKFLPCAAAILTIFWQTFLWFAYVSMQERNRRKRERWKMLPSNRKCLRIFPLCRDKRQIGISSHLIFFFYTPTICSITGKQTVRWDLLADSAFEVLCCALIRDNLSNGLLWSPWAENEINPMEMTQLLQSNTHTIWAEDWYHRLVPSSIFLYIEKSLYDKNSNRKKQF